MKKIIPLLLLIFGGICVMFIAISPDVISITVTIIMSVAVLCGVFFGLVPNLLYVKGFKNGIGSIKSAKEVNSDNIWTTVANALPFFHQKELDELFENYIENVKNQKSRGIVISDIEDYINEDAIAIRSWRGVVIQIAGTLTSLGLLGTFLGLITGVSEVTFSTVEATMSSIEVLLRGIATAFYTSIVGVILSILFNVAYRLVWNIMLRQMNSFIEEFHTKIQPSADEQLRSAQIDNSEKILESLEILKDNSTIMLSSTDNQSVQQQRMMVDILSGMNRGEFSTVYEPVFELADKTVVKAKCAFRWNHETLGVINPSVYMPIVSSTGYITKMNRQLWDDVCRSMKQWKEQGNHPVTAVLCVAKNDLMALDIPASMSTLAQRYSLEPRDIEIGLDAECYDLCPDEAAGAQEQLLKAGFRVSIDNFKGNFINVQNTAADELRINVESLNDTKEISMAFEQARNAHISMSAQNISSAQQLAELIKAGCKFGQGKHLQQALTTEEFAAFMQYGE